MKITDTRYVLMGLAFLLATGGTAYPEEAAAPSVDLNEKQINAIKVATAQVYGFPVEKEAIGSVDFNEDMTVQVFPPYQGKIIKANAQLGDYIRKGAPLFTIDSPDLIQGEATLISAAAAKDLTSAALARAKALYEKEGLAQKDYQQAISDAQTADGDLRAAKDALRVFGKSEAEIERVVASRKIDPVLVVVSPISGRITARNAQPGLLVQPGNAPAPYAISEVNTKWLLASIPETEAADYHTGQAVTVSVSAFPDRRFEGIVEKLSSTVDPNTHRLTVRTSIRDPKDDLRPNMFASFVITVGEPARSVGVPLSGIVREGDGRMSAWVTLDGRHFTQRTVTIGMQKNGYDQILTGLKAGEKVVTDGAIFLSNMLSSGASD